MLTYLSSGRRSRHSHPVRRNPLQGLSLGSESIQRTPNARSRGGMVLIHEMYAKYFLPTPYKFPAYWYTDGLIAVTADDILRVGHNLSVVQFPPAAGGGYMAATVGTHQLHCLHYIWKDHHRGYFPDLRQKIADMPEVYELHYEHCIDYIRQGVMCNFDTGIIPYSWVGNNNNPTPNSNTLHRCVDWDSLQDWLGSRAVEVPEGFVWKQPEDAVRLEWNL